MKGAGAGLDEIEFSVGQISLSGQIFAGIFLILQKDNVFIVCYLTVNTGKKIGLR